MKLHLGDEPPQIDQIPVHSVIKVRQWLVMIVDGQRFLRLQKKKAPPNAGCGIVDAVIVSHHKRLA